MRYLLPLLMVSFTGCAVFPPYRVWSAENDGKAILAEAESSRRVKVLEAQAAADASIMQAKAQIEMAKASKEAEVIRAQGVAEANRIIGDSLKNSEAYLRYLWITKTGDAKEVIYIPTEAGMPILEAGRVGGEK
jgi:vacuolar-type H+-ATPase subunit H